MHIFFVLRKERGNLIQEVSANETFSFKIMVVNFRENTEELLIERLIKGFDHARMVKWARTLLNSGRYAESLIILAGMEKATSEEIEKYFLRSIDELELNIPKDIRSQLREYANDIALRVLNGEMCQDYGFLQILKVAKVSDRDFRYAGFSDIEEDLDNLFYGRKTKRDGLTLENQKAYIREEFKLFSAMEMLDIPLNMRQQEYCMICGKLSTPYPKKKYSVSRPFIYHALSCDHCRSERLKSAAQHFVKRKIIQTYQLQGS